MPIRPFALALLIAVAPAHAATKAKPKPAAPVQQTPVENIDVDAMARAKDTAAGAAVPTDPAPTDPTKPADPASAEPTAPTDPASAENTTPNDAAPSTPAPAAAPAEKASAPASAPSEARVPPLLAPTPDDSERRLAAGCEARATALLDAAQKADYASATTDFDAKMHTALPPAKFKQTWESLAKFGALTARGQTHLSKSEGYVAVTIPLLFEKANLYAQVACGSDGRIAGFYVKPLNVPQS